jgi:hypothetical protein
MNKIIKFPQEIQEDPGFSPWENTPSRSSTRGCKRLSLPKNIPSKSQISPYRPRTIQSKQVTRRYSLIVHNIIYETPPRSREFPKRSFKSPAKFIKKDAERYKLRENDGISVNELENIERIQQLIPYQPGLIIEPRHKSTRPIFSTTSIDAKIDLGIIKESNFTSTFYKRFNKHQIF